MSEMQSSHCDVFPMTPMKVPHVTFLLSGRASMVCSKMDSISIHLLGLWLHTCSNHARSITFVWRPTFIHAVRSHVAASRPAPPSILD
eukprot:4161592-Amphidinium_carterae.1